MRTPAPGRTRWLRPWRTRKPRVRHVDRRSSPHRPSPQPPRYGQEGADRVRSGQPARQGGQGQPDARRDAVLVPLVGAQRHRRAYPDGVAVRPRHLVRGDQGKPHARHYTLTSRGRVKYCRMIEYRRGTGRGRTAAPGKDTDMGRTQTVGRAEEAGERGWGRRLSEQTSFQMDPELANLVRIIKANEGRSVGEILR